jgi:hypothetical protein
MFVLVKEHQLEQLQGKVEYLKNEANMLEWGKTKATNQLLVLNRTIDEFQGNLKNTAQRTEMTYMNQENEFDSGVF